MVLEGIDLVHAQDGWFFRLPEQMRYLHIKLRHTFVHINHQHHDIRFADSQIDLTVDLTLEGIVAVDHPSSGVDHTELTTTPFGFAVLTVTRRARRIHHYRPTGAR